MTNDKVFAWLSSSYSHAQIKPRQLQIPANLPIFCFTWTDSKLTWHISAVVKGIWNYKFWRQKTPHYLEAKFKWLMGMSRREVIHQLSSSRAPCIVLWWDLHMNSEHHKGKKKNITKYITYVTSLMWAKNPMYRHVHNEYWKRTWPNTTKDRF